MSEQNNTPQTTTGDAETLRKLVEGQRFVMFTTVDESGALVSRPMTVQEITDGWVLRFITQRSNDVAVQGAGQQVNLALVDGGSYVSLSGVGTVVDDLAAKEELWNRLNEAYAGEASDPENVILDVAVQSGEYWDGGNPIARVLGLAKAAITGKAPESGEHGTVTTD